MKRHVCMAEGLVMRSMPEQCLWHGFAVRCSAQASQVGASQAGAPQAAPPDGYALPPSQLPYAIPGVSDRGRGTTARASSNIGGGDAAGALAHTNAGYGYAYGGAAGKGPATQLPCFQQARAGGPCLPCSASVIRGVLQALKKPARRLNCRLLRSGMIPTLSGEYLPVSTLVREQPPSAQHCTWATLCKCGPLQICRAI